MFGKIWKWLIGGRGTWERVRLIVFLLVIITIAAAVVLTPTALYNTFSLMVRKSIGYLTPVLLAHFLRIGLFPYIDLSEILSKDQPIGYQLAGSFFVAVWYGVSIWAFSIGG
jgi:hypothetical protein